MLTILLGIFAAVGVSIQPLIAFQCNDQGEKPRVSVPEGTELVELVENGYREVTALKADFTQISERLGLEEPIVSQGKLSFKKPGMMDWKYLKPGNQRIISDGKVLWHYEPEMEQVKIVDFSQSFESEVPMSFLLGLGDLSDNFELVESCPAGNSIRLVFEPKKEDPSVSVLELIVRDKTYRPIAVKVVDLGGSENTIRLSQINYSPKLKDSQFTFEIPRGVYPDDLRQEKNVESSRARPISEEPIVVEARPEL